MTFNELKARIDKVKERDNLSDEIYDYDIRILDGNSFNKILIPNEHSLVVKRNKCVELYTYPIVTDI
jgi:hypothetical protein